MMKNDDFKLLKGFAFRRTDGQTFVIVESVTSATENYKIHYI